ncbi:MAG: PQQ-binding-like beta-propeller repeat protein [Jatrophihabitans sp.]
MSRRLSARLWASVVAAALVLAAGCSVDGTADRRSSSTRPPPGPGIAGTGTLPNPASAWPAAGFDARHSSGTTAVGPQTGRVRWQKQLGGSVTPGPVIGVDGSVLAATNAGVLHALNPATGQERWAFDGMSRYGSDLSTSPAVLGDGTILWPGPGDMLFALSSAGRELWHEQFAGQPLSPAIAGVGRVYVSDLAGHLTALQVTGVSHRVVWTLELHTSNDYASATVGPDGTVYTAADHDLVAVRDLGDSGTELWRRKTASTVEVSNPVGPDGTVVLGTNGDKEFGVRSDGSTGWAFDKNSYTYSSAVVRPDAIAYFGDNAGHLRALNSQTGKLIYDVQGSAERRTASIWTSPVVDAHGDAYVATVTGHIYGFDARGHQLFDVATGSQIDCYPSIDADGTLYIGSTSGVLYAVGGS